MELVILLIIAALLGFRFARSCLAALFWIAVFLFLLMLIIVVGNMPAD